MYKCQRYFLMTLDPVHVGTGGYRLGRVDMSIVREPGTQLPKIPGTSLSGAIRAYAARLNGDPRCSGQGQERSDAKGHCRDDNCPVCYTFGYIRGQEGGQSGVVNIGDARLLLFPVHSMAGPIWVISPMLLNSLKNGEGPVKDDLKNKVKLPTSLSDRSNLNLGWLLLEGEGDFDLAKELSEDAKGAIPEEIRKRTVLLSDELLSQVVNDNLEVRTSVSIDPATGAAKRGALFTYEAIPRAAIMWLDVIEDDYRQSFPKENENGWKKPLDVVKAGLKQAEYLGVGGMGTRGFGRLRLLGENAGKEGDNAETA